MVSGSLAEVPPALLAQLKIGGRLMAIVGDEPMMRATLIERTSEANYLTRQPWDTVVPRMAHFVEPSHFHF
jgi:protein-L-isoaspartate(D-aspartate) O-methyltransferase